MIDNSFQLLRTNPALTSNVKIIITSGDTIYLESINSNLHLTLNNYKKYFINKESLLEKEIFNFYKNTSSEIIFYIKNDDDVNNMYKDYNNQFDNIYFCGASKIENKQYDEEFEYFAPLYIKKNNIPEGFIILKVNDSNVYNTNLNIHKLENINKDNFYDEVIDKWKCVTYINLKKDSNIGYFLNENINNNKRFPEHSFYYMYNNTTFSKWYGLDYTKGIYTNKNVDLKDLINEYPHFKLENIITNGFKENNLIYPYIFNLNFLFNDKTAKDYTFNRYYGFYIDKLEKIAEISTYKQIKIKDNLKIKNNIFLDQYDNYVYPYLTDNITTEQYIKINNIYYLVRKIKYNKTISYYKIISDIVINYDNLIDVVDNNEFNITNNIINSNKTYDLDIFIDKDLNKNIMYCSLYLIEINKEYHILKNINEQYFIQSDYNINSDNYNLKISNIKEDISIDILKSDVYIKYNIYRLKFNDIKDFDFDRIDTNFSDFDFEKSTYSNIIENKINVIEYRDNSTPKQKRLYNSGLDGQYNLLNASTEYIDELFEIDLNNNLTNIWNKNQYICKWGMNGSNSHSNYPYKLNNSLYYSDSNNRTVDVFKKDADILSKNLDYFYRIGNYYKYDFTYNYSNDLLSNDGSFTSNITNWYLFNIKYEESNNNYYLTINNDTVTSDAALEYFSDLSFKNNDDLSIEFDLFELNFSSGGYIKLSNTDEYIVDENLTTNSLIHIKKENLIIKTNLESVNFRLEFCNVNYLKIDNIKVYIKEKCKINKNYLNQTINIETELLKTKTFDVDYYFNNSFDYFDYFFKNSNYIEYYGNKKTLKNYNYSVINLDNNQFSTLFKGIKYNFTGLDTIILDSSNNIDYFINTYKDFSNYKFSFILSENYNVYNLNNTENITSSIVGLGDIKMLEYENNINILTNTALTNKYYSFESGETSGYVSIIYYYKYIETGITYDNISIYLKSDHVISFEHNDNGLTYNLKLKITGYNSYFDTYDIYLTDNLENINYPASNVIHINDYYIDEQVFDLNIHTFGGNYYLISKYKATYNNSYFMLNSLLNTYYLYVDEGYHINIDNTPDKAFNKNTSISNYNKLLDIDTKNGLHVICNDTYKNILLILNINIPIENKKDLYEFNNLSDNLYEKFGLYSTINNNNNLIKDNNGYCYNSNEIVANKFIYYLNNFETNSFFNKNITYYLISGDTYGCVTLNDFNISTMNNVWKNKFPTFNIKCDFPLKVDIYNNSYKFNGVSLNDYILNKFYIYNNNNVEKISKINEPVARNYVENKNIKKKLSIYRYNGSYDVIFNNIELFDNTYYWDTNYNINCFYSNYKFNKNIDNFGNIKEIIYSKINEEKNILKLKDEESYKSSYPMIDEYGHAYTNRFIFKSTWDNNFYLKTLEERYFYTEYFENLGYINNEDIYNLNVIIEDDNIINIKTYEYLAQSKDYLQFVVYNRDTISRNIKIKQSIINYNTGELYTSKINDIEILAKKSFSSSILDEYMLYYHDILSSLDSNLTKIEYIKLKVLVEILDVITNKVIDFDEKTLLIDNNNISINFYNFFGDVEQITYTYLVDNFYNFNITTNINSNDSNYDISKYGTLTMKISNKYNNYIILNSKNINITTKDSIVKFDHIYLDPIISDKSETEKRNVLFEFKYKDFLNVEKIIYSSNNYINVKNNVIPQSDTGITSITPYLITNSNFMYTYISKTNNDVLSVSLNLKNYSKTDYYDLIIFEFKLNGTIISYAKEFNNIVYIKNNTTFTVVSPDFIIDKTHGCFENNMYTINIKCVYQNSSNTALTNAIFQKSFYGKRKLNQLSNSLLNNSSSTCIDINSLILMSDNKYKKIIDLKENDLVKSYNFNKTLNYEDEWINWSSDNTYGISTTSVVKKVKYFKVKGYYIINDRLKITGEHPILIYKNNIWKWVRVNDINEGDFMLNNNNTKTPVITKIYINEELDVCLIDVEKYDNYYINGILIHNTK